MEGATPRAVPGMTGHEEATERDGGIGESNRARRRERAEQPSVTEGDGVEEDFGARQGKWQNGDDPRSRFRHNGFPVCGWTGRKTVTLGQRRWP